MLIYILDYHHFSAVIINIEINLPFFSSTAAAAPLVTAAVAAAAAPPTGMDDNFSLPKII